MSAAKFWPRESRNLIGPLTIELSTEVNCLRDFNPTAIAKEQPRNKSAEVKCVALINSRRSRRIGKFNSKLMFGENRNQVAITIFSLFIHCLILMSFY